MSDIAEAAIQAALVDRLTKPDLGWRFAAWGALHRTTDSVLVESEVAAALRRLNPASRPTRSAWTRCCPACARWSSPLPMTGWSSPTAA